MSGFRPAWIKWYNAQDGEKVACVSGKGAFEAVPYGSTSYREFHAEGKPPHPEHGYYQWGFACSPSTLIIGLDGDYPDAWPQTATGKLLGPWRDVATSVRDLDDGTFKFHVVIEVPAALLPLWPKQLAAKFGHVKSNGLIYATGVCKDGTAYAETGNPRVVATEALMDALLADNGNILHTDSSATPDDDFEELSKDWTDPDGTYPARLAAVVLGNWTEGTRNDSLPARCGLIKAGGDQGAAGMAALFSELCAEYDAETGRGDAGVYRAFARAHPAWAKYGSLMEGAAMPQEWEQAAQERTARAAANGSSAASVTEASGAVKPRGVLEPGGLTDAYLADRVVAGALAGKFLWAAGLGWLAWDGKRWAMTDDVPVVEAVRGFVIDLHAAAAAANMPVEVLAKISALLSKARITAITDLCRGVPAVYRQAGDFDADPDVLNTPAGVVDLRTGATVAHDPAQLHTKVTAGNYRPGYAHPDWTAALSALDAPERAWYQRRVGQGITGHPTPDGVLVLLQGSGENGKSSLTTDGLVPALGDYADMASHKLFASQRAGRSEHSTEMADLRGKRLLIGEELSEGRSLDVTAIKRIMDVGRIKARLVYRDNMTFAASHSLFVATNYDPLINECDHGTWRRLGMLRFRYTYRKPGEPLTEPLDRPGDLGLKPRIRAGNGGQHDAIVTWAVEGARQWYADQARSLALTRVIADDTAAWRAESDRVFGWWHDWLVAERGSRVIATEMLAGFNAWLGQNGHGAWSRETFGQRFGQHSETARHGVERKRTIVLTGLSRWAGLAANGWVSDPPEQATVWDGVRFKTRSELGLAALAEPPELPLHGGDIGKLADPVQGLQPDRPVYPGGASYACRACGQDLSVCYGRH